MVKIPLYRNGLDVYYRVGWRNNGMIFPLEQLVEYKGNMYEITSAASRRAYQLSMMNDPEIEENDGKVVSLAARQIFTKAIEFRLED